MCPEWANPDQIRVAHNLALHAVCAESLSATSVSWVSGDFAGMAAAVLSVTSSRSSVSRLFFFCTREFFSVGMEGELKANFVCLPTFFGCLVLPPLGTLAPTTVLVKTLEKMT